MKKDFVNEESKTKGEAIVIADECGDSMWDAVLNQEVKACDVKKISADASLLLNRINAAQEYDATVPNRYSIR